ncbi:MAG: hypothetical protein AB7F86_09030, partial [Bdellovibrionales bacterium]
MGCILRPPAPYLEYTLARSAVQAAAETDSARFATSLWNRAEENYRSGEKSYKSADYAEAADFFK